MRWNRHGLIFDPTHHKLPHGCSQFAQSPQVLLFDDFVRVYFSTRVTDSKNGKFLSHVAFVDYDLNFSKILRVSDHEVIPLGDLGTFDEHGIFPFHVMRKDDLIYAYTCGWSRRVSVSVETGIGLAISKNQGETFSRMGTGPILSSSLKEPCLVGDAFVREYQGRFHMWYIFGTGWKQYESTIPPDRNYKIGYATSCDGINWSKREGRAVIPEKIGPEESQALPSVIHRNGIYLMVFCYRHSFNFRSNPDRGYHLGYAWSKDLSNWNRDDNLIQFETGTNEWDSDMQCYPHVFKIKNKTYMLYNGNKFGRNGFGLASLEDN